MNALINRSPPSCLDAEVEITDLTVLGTGLLCEWAVELSKRENLACFDRCTKSNCPHACPPVMVPLLVYCYAAGIYRSRAIEELTFEEENLKRLAGDKWIQASQIRCFRREHRELLRRCLGGLIHEAVVRSGITAQSSHSAARLPNALMPELWACEFDAEARIQLAIRWDSMELDE